MQISILGLGLIGSSIARGCKQFMPGAVIHAYDINPLTLQYASQQGFIDEAFEEPAGAVHTGDIIIISAPPSASIELIGEIASAIKQGAMVMDVCSVKTPISLAFQEQLPEGVAFMPAHPIAGSEQAGVSAGRADLFVGKRVILTPDSPENPHIRQAADFWEKLGGVVEYMPAEIHDMIYAYVSHLPQLLAFAMRPMLETLDASIKLPQHFKDFTRLCHSDRRLWDDIFISNKAELDQALARFLVMLSVIRKELAEGMIAHANQAKPELEKPESEVLVELLPRVVASCLVGTIAQESKHAGFNFVRFAGKGFNDFTAPLKEAPDKHLEDISNYAKQVVDKMDILLAHLAEWVVIKSS